MAAAVVHPVAHVTCPVALCRAHGSMSYMQALLGPTRRSGDSFNNEVTVNQPETFYVGFQ